MAERLSEEVVEVSTDDYGVRVRFSDDSVYGITWGFIFDHVHKDGPNDDGKGRVDG